MGKGFVFVIFIIGFIFFAIIKLVITGTKAAYEAVFDPDAKEEKVRELIASCMLVVHQIMTEKYTKQPGELSIAIMHLTPAIQSIILENGYQVDAEIARKIVCNAIVSGGHATQEEVDLA